MSTKGTDESVNYSGSSRSERGAQNFLPANLERQLHFQIRTLAPRVQNQESRAKGSFNSSWFWGRQCPLMAGSCGSRPSAVEDQKSRCQVQGPVLGWWSGAFYVAGFVHYRRWYWCIECTEIGVA